jgi:hypothetical protein
MLLELSVKKKKYLTFLMLAFQWVPHPNKLVLAYWIIILLPSFIHWIGEEMFSILLESTSNSL